MTFQGISLYIVLLCSLCLSEAKTIQTSVPSLNSSENFHNNTDADAPQRSIAKRQTDNFHLDDPALKFLINKAMSEYGPCSNNWPFNSVCSQAMETIRRNIFRDGENQFRSNIEDIDDTQNSDIEDVTGIQPVFDTHTTIPEDTIGYQPIYETHTTYLEDMPGDHPVYYNVVNFVKKPIPPTLCNSTSPESASNCCLNLEEGSLFPDMLDCRRLYRCVGGQAERLFCSLQQQFDKKQLTCVPSSQARCATSRDLVEETTVHGHTVLSCEANDQSEAEACCSDSPHRYLSYITNYDSCDYFMCLNNFTTHVDCPAGTFFDVDVEACKPGYCPPILTTPGSTGETAAVSNVDTTKVAPVDTPSETPVGSTSDIPVDSPSNVPVDSPPDVPVDSNLVSTEDASAVTPDSIPERSTTSGSENPEGSEDDIATAPPTDVSPTMIIYDNHIASCLASDHASANSCCQKISNTDTVYIKQRDSCEFFYSCEERIASFLSCPLGWYFDGRSASCKLGSCSDEAWTEQTVPEQGVTESNVVTENPSGVSNSENVVTESNKISESPENNSDNPIINSNVETKTTETVIISETVKGSESPETVTQAKVDTETSELVKTTEEAVTESKYGSESSEPSTSSVDTKTTQIVSNSDEPASNPNSGGTVSSGLTITVSSSYVLSCIVTDKSSADECCSSIISQEGELYYIQMFHGCDSFFICEQGTTRYVTCPVGWHFDATDAACMPGSCAPTNVDSETQASTIDRTTSLPSSSVDTSSSTVDSTTQSVKIVTSVTSSTTAHNKHSFTGIITQLKSLYAFLEDIERPCKLLVQNLGHDVAIACTIWQTLMKDIRSILQIIEGI